MKQGSTLFLKVAVYLIAVTVLGVCIVSLGLPLGIIEGDGGSYWPLLPMLYIPAVPFFIALYHGMKLLNNVDNNIAFSDASVKSLNIIKYSALAIFLVFCGNLPYIYEVADSEDAPGVMLIGLIFTFIVLIVTVFAAVLQKLIQSAVELKSENDLTV